MWAVAEVQQSAKSVKSAKSAKRLKNECQIGCKPLFYNRIMTIGLRYKVYIALLAIWVCILVAS